MIFDFGSVIYRTDWDGADRRFYEKQGFHIRISDVKDVRLREELERIYAGSDTGKFDLKDLMLKLKPDVADINGAIRDYKEAYSKSKVASKGMLKIIGELRKSGMMLFGFSDVKMEHHDANKRAGIYDGFEKVFTSYGFGSTKADASSFGRLARELERYASKPNECIFVDDKEQNIENARALGFRVIHYTDFPSTERFEVQLRKLLSDARRA